MSVAVDPQEIKLNQEVRAASHDTSFYLEVITVILAVVNYSGGCITVIPVSHL